MFQFRKSENNAESSYLTGYCQDFSLYCQNTQTDDQRTL